MNKLVLVLAGLALSSATLAGPSSYAEFALVTGGEGDTSRNSGGKENGFEFAGEAPQIFHNPDDDRKNTWFDTGLRGKTTTFVQKYRKSE